MTLLFILLLLILALIGAPLFLIVGGLFLVNLVVPDLIPFYDEILMAMLTVLIASIRKRGHTLDPADGAGPPDNQP